MIKSSGNAFFYRKTYLHNSSYNSLFILWAWRRTVSIRISGGAAILSWLFSYARLMENSVGWAALPSGFSYSDRLSQWTWPCSKFMPKLTHGRRHFIILVLHPHRSCPLSIGIVRKYSRILFNLFLDNTTDSHFGFPAGSILLGFRNPVARGFGGPRQLFDLKRTISNSASWNRPISSFSRAKRPFFSDTYGESKTIF